MMNVFKQCADIAYSVHGIGIIARRPDTNEHTIQLDKAYLQLNSWACGAAAAATIICHYHPEVDADEIYAVINPTQEEGTLDGVMMCTMKDYRIQMVKMHVGLEKLKAVLKAGRLVLALQNAVDVDGSDCLHYVVVYGEHKGMLYVAGPAGNWKWNWKMKYGDFTKNGGRAVYAASKTKEHCR